MSTNLAAIGYLVAAVCFILALRGLSSPASSRAGNRYGMVGMTIAIVVTPIRSRVMAGTRPASRPLIWPKLTIPMLLIANIAEKAWGDAP